MNFNIRSKDDITECGVTRRYLSLISGLAKIKNMYGAGISVYGDVAPRVQRCHVMSIHINGLVENSSVIVIALLSLSICAIYNAVV